MGFLDLGFKVWGLGFSVPFRDPNYGFPCSLKCSVRVTIRLAKRVVSRVWGPWFRGRGFSVEWGYARSLEALYSVAGFAWVCGI